MNLVGEGVLQGQMVTPIDQQLVLRSSTVNGRFLGPGSYAHLSAVGPEDEYS